MTDMIVEFILDHPYAVLPKYSKEGDAGLDLVAVDCGINLNKDYIEYDTGIIPEIPEGYEGQLRPRSSISNYGLTLCNSVGTIDSNFRGRIRARFRRNSKINTKVYETGDRICQLIITPIPKIVPKEKKNTATETNRGKDGFGSSGK